MCVLLIPVLLFYSGICQISVSDFEEARMSFGTDEDLIAIRLKS